MKTKDLMPIDSYSYYTCMVDKKTLYDTQTSNDNECKIENNVMLFISVTLATLGTLVAAFIKSSDANLVLLKVKSKAGPISSSSTLGVLLPDFFNIVLFTKKCSKYCM